MNRVTRSRSLPQRQRGAALVLSLVMLLLLTFMGVAAMNTANLQEKMVGNLQDSQVAFEMAEMALRQGESWLAAQSGQAAAAPSPTADQVYEEGALAAGWWRTFDWQSGTARVVDVDSSLLYSGGASQWYVTEAPRLVITELGAIKIGRTTDADVFMQYAIVARGYGGREGMNVTLEGTFSKKIN